MNFDSSLDESAQSFFVSLTVTTSRRRMTPSSIAALLLLGTSASLPLREHLWLTWSLRVGSNILRFKFFGPFILSEISTALDAWYHVLQDCWQLVPESMACRLGPIYVVQKKSGPWLSTLQQTSKTKLSPQNTPNVLMPNLCGSYIQNHDVLTGADQDRLVWSGLTTLEGGLDTVSFEKKYSFKLFNETTRRAYPLPWRSSCVWFSTHPSKRRHRKS